MDRRKTATILIAILLFTALCCACAPQEASVSVAEELPDYYRSRAVTPTSSYAFEARGVPVRVTEFRDDLGEETVLKGRSYDLENGDSVFAGSLQGGGGTGNIKVFETVCRKPELRYFRGGEWHVSSQQGIFRAGCIFLDTDEGSYILYLPRGYERIRNNCIRELEDGKGWLEVRRTADGDWRVSLFAPLPGKNGFSDFFLCRTPSAAVDWEDSEAADLWQILTNDGAWRMLYDGYYYESAGNYDPSGEGVFANRPACYLAWVLTHHASAYPVMNSLNCFVLDSMIRCQNEEGFWPSDSKSRWLYAKYGVDAGYYDTRFNSDLMETLLMECAVSSWPELEDSISAYFDFYLQYAKQFGREGENGGLFVPDYYEYGMRSPHTSLNHQLSEISVLLKGGRLLGREDLTELALQMLAAIEGTEDSWIRSDGNLEYALYPGGEFGGTDYPYLTYNDLLALQRTLRKTGFEPNRTLMHLMTSKKIWMDTHGITGYAR